VLVHLLSSPDVDVQYYCTTALSNIAVDDFKLIFLIRGEVAQGERCLALDFRGG
jgi:hypothetical protein